MKPYVICHMMSSVDGRIDCAMTAEIDKTDAYYEALDSLQFDAVLEGRVSRQMHYALPEPFMANKKLLLERRNIALPIRRTIMT